MRPTNLALRVLKVNYKVLKLFFCELFELQVKGLDLDPVLIDLEVYPNSILTTAKVQKFLRSYFDEVFFVKAPSRLVSFTQYLNFKKKVSLKTVEKGSIVKLILDGDFYIVDQINLQKNRATVSKIVKNRVSNITLRVKIENLVPSNLDFQLES